MRRGQIARWLFTVAFPVAAAVPSFAQTNIPGVPTREELTRPVAPPEPRPPRVRVDGDIERSPCALADPSYTDIKVTIGRATFSRLIGMTEAELEPVYRAYLGPDRPVSDICEIRDAVATALRQRGYLAAVQVPTQEIKGGEVRFEVLYARLSAIRVRGNAGHSEALVARYLQGLTQDEVFNFKDAERALLLARDLPGLDVHLALKPTGKAGEVYGDVSITYTPIEADLNIQNLGSQANGPWGGQARIQFNGLTGMGDRTTIAYYTAAEFSEQKLLQLGHEFRLGDDGLQISGRFTHAWTRPDLEDAPDLVRARTLFATLEARYPLVRTQASTLWASVGLDFVNQKVRFEKVHIAQDKLRFAFFRLDGDMVDRPAAGAPQWHAAYWAEFRQGLHILDATDWPHGGGTPPSRADGKTGSTLVRGGMSGELTLARNISAAASVTGQVSADPLFSFEEFSAGNYTVGRGYDPGTLIGDDGVGVSLELRVDRWAPARALVVQPFAFMDFAKVWNKGAGGEDLVSVGGGVRASYADRYRLDLTLAVPMQRAGLDDERGDPRLLMSFTTKLWPLGGE